MYIDTTYPVPASIYISYIYTYINQSTIILYYVSASSNLQTLHLYNDEQKGC